MKTLFVALIFLSSFGKEISSPIKSIEIKDSDYQKDGVKGPFSDLFFINQIDSLNVFFDDHMGVLLFGVSKKTYSNEEALFLAPINNVNDDCSFFHSCENGLFKPRCEKWGFSYVDHYREEHQIIFDIENKKIYFAYIEYEKKSLDTVAVITY